MESESYKVVWLCKYQKKIRTFTWDTFTDDRQMNRIVFHDEITDEVLTLSNDSYAWMVTRPANLDINDN